MRLIKFIILIVFLGLTASFFSTNLIAQHRSIFSNLKSAEKRANDLHAKGAYSEAIGLYQQVLNKNSDNVQAKLKIAECYTKLNEQDQAVLWYKEVMQNTSVVQPNHKLSYAQALTSVENYPQAKIWFEEYLQDVPDDRRAKFQLEAIAHLNTFYRDSTNYLIKRLKINTAHADFGPVFYNEGLVFVSGRETKKPLKYVFTLDQSAFLDLYYSKIDSSGDLSSPVKMQRDLNSKYHDGPISFFENGKRILFGKNDFQKSKGKDNIKTLKLFEAEKASEGNTWINIKEVPFNSDYYSVAHPSINNDGNILYFASDMPGGFGQSDIYISRKINGSWSKPENLGASVNTEGKEMFPFLHNHSLYFASDGLGGLGGLDIFKVNLNNANATPRNMGAPVNSPKDDFGLILNDKNTGYFSTNRIKNNKDDIYWVKFRTEGIKTIEVLSGKEQLFVYSDGVLYEYVTGDSIKMLKNKNNIKVLSNQINKVEGETLFDEFVTFIDPSVVNSRVFIKSIYYNFDKSDLTEANREELRKIAGIMKEYSDFTLTINAFTDSRGTRVYNLGLSKKRAFEAYNYLLSQGINKSRIITRSFGKSKLLKPCPTLKDCNKEDHQLNRRGEFVLNLE